MATLDNAGVSSLYYFSETLTNSTVQVQMTDYLVLPVAVDIRSSVWQCGTSTHD